MWITNQKSKSNYLNSLAISILQLLRQVNAFQTVSIRSVFDYGEINNKYIVLTLVSKATDEWNELPQHLDVQSAVLQLNNSPMQDPSLRAT